MSTAGQVTDRVYRDWLHPADDQPLIFTFDGAVASGDTVWTYDQPADPEDENVFAEGVVVEAGQDQRRIRSVDADNNQITVSGAINGTTAEAHSDGDEFTAAPVFARRTVFDAMCDNVEALYPSLWRTDTTTLTTSSTYVEVPADVVTVENFTYLSGTRYLEGQVRLLANFPPSSTDKAVEFYGVPNGKTGYLTWRGKFARPSAESDDLATLGVEARWERIVAVGAAAQVVSGRPVEQLTAEFIVEALEREGLPVGGPESVRDGLLRLRQLWIDEAQGHQQGDSQVPVVFNRVLA